MFRRHPRRWALWSAATVTLSVALTGLLGSPAARAQVALATGSEVVPNVFNPAPGAVLASATQPFSGVSFAGTLTAAVVRNELNTLDFYYQVTNSAGSGTSLGRVTGFFFEGFTTSVFYRSTTGGLGGFVIGSETPDTADRDASGVVGFNFLEGTDPATSGKVNPGETSSILVIRTNATNFTTGGSSVINGGAVTVAAFSPAVPGQAAIPETGTIALFALGLLPLAAALRRPRA